MTWRVEQTTIPAKRDAVQPERTGTGPNRAADALRSFSPHAM